MTAQWQKQQWGLSPVASNRVADMKIVNVAPEDAFDRAKWRRIFRKADPATWDKRQEEEGPGPEATRALSEKAIPFTFTNKTKVYVCLCWRC